VPGLQPGRVDALDIDADNVDLIGVGLHHPRRPERGGIGDVEDAELACADRGEEVGEVEFVAEGEDVDCAVQDLREKGRRSVFEVLGLEGGGEAGLGWVGGGAYVEAGGLGGVDGEEGDAAAPDVVFAAVEGDAQDGWGEDWRGAGRGRRGQGCVREEG